MQNWHLHCLKNHMNENISKSHFCSFSIMRHEDADNEVNTSGKRVMGRVDDIFFYLL